MERRYSLRKHIAQNAMLDFFGTTAQVVIRDINMGGLFIETSVRLPMNAVVMLAFAPHEDSDHCECCQLTTLVVHHATAGIGVMFLDLAPVAVRALYRSGGAATSEMAVNTSAPAETSFPSSFSSSHHRRKP